MELEVGRDKLKYPRFILADPGLVLAAVRANLLGLGDVMLDAYLRQAIVIGLPRLAWFSRRLGVACRRRGRHDGKVGRVDLEEVPLSGGIHQAFPPRTENIAAVEIELVTQFVDRLLLFLDSLVVELGGLFECGAVVRQSSLMVRKSSLEIRDLLSVLAQQIVAFAGTSGP